MPKIDLTISISVIVAIAAIISPILTAIINNHYQIKLKRIEANQKEYEETVLHKRCIFENYIKASGKCIQHSDTSALKEYGEYYFHALMFADPDLRNDMMEAHKYMQDNDWIKASSLIEELSAKIYTSLQIK